MDTILDPLRLLSFPYLLRYLGDWVVYSRLEGAEKIHLLDTMPCLRDRIAKTPFDRHYFYQDIFALRLISESKTKLHVDVGSNVVLAGMLTAVTQVVFVDIRPITATLDRLCAVSGDIVQLPFADNSIQSVSCLHVAEHIGLGRYGDALDPQGTQKAAKELSRILAHGGNLYFSLPIGKPRLCFNAHRIHSPTQILHYFEGLDLVEFSGIDDYRNFHRNIEPTALAQSEYACGFYWFRKPAQDSRRHRAVLAGS